MDTMRDEQRRYYGKYRGIVTDNDDPSSLGRLRARVPEALSDVESGWALPAVPYAGDGVGMLFLPPAGAGVWIEFEAGDLSRPIWSGCFWASGQLPEGAGPDVKVIKTGAHTLTFDDGDEKIELLHSSGTRILIDQDGLTIEHSGGATIMIDSSSITIDNNGPKITLDASGIVIEQSGKKIAVTSSSVAINETALEIT